MVKFLMGLFNQADAVLIDLDYIFIEEKVGVFLNFNFDCLTMLDLTNPIHLF